MWRILLLALVVAQVTGGCTHRLSEFGERQISLTAPHKVSYLANGDLVLSAELVGYDRSSGQIDWRQPRYFHYPAADLLARLQGHNDLGSPYFLRYTMEHMTPRDLGRLPLAALPPAPAHTDATPLIDRPPSPKFNSANETINYPHGSGSTAITIASSGHNCGTYQPTPHKLAVLPLYPLAFAVDTVGMVFVLSYLLLTGGHVER